MHFVCAIVHLLFDAKPFSSLALSLSSVTLTFVTGCTNPAGFGFLARNFA